MKKYDAFDFFFDKIKDDKDYIKLEGEDFYYKVTFNTFIAFYENLSSSEAYDLEIKKSFNKLKRENDLLGIYDLIKKEYLYRYIRIDVKSTEFPKLLNRVMLLPLRQTVYETMISVLSTLNSFGYHLVSLYKNKISFETPISLMEDEFAFSNYSAIDNYLIDIIDLKSVTLWYDYGEDWKFKITFKDYIYKDEFIPFDILKFKGNGIIEDNKFILYDYQNGNLNEEYKDYIEEFNDNDLEKLKEKSYNDYDLLLKAYAGIKEEFEE